MGSSATAPAARHDRVRWLVALALGVGVLSAFALAAPDGPAPSAQPLPGASGPIVSAGRHFVAVYAPGLTPIPLERTHTWTVRLHDSAGTLVDTAAIAVRGDMPGHGHGLPTQPKARAVGEGTYLIEGVRFQMPGEWYLELEITAGTLSDTVRFDFTIP